MEPILVDDRLDPGKFSDLMDERFGIRAGKLVTTAATGTRDAVDRVADLLGRDQGAVGLAMSGLAATLLLAGRRGGLPLQPDRIRRGRLGGVGGVELQTILQVLDSRFELCELLFVVLDKRKDRRLNFWRSRLP
jgi:hypothetical protein